VRRQKQRGRNNSLFSLFITLLMLSGTNDVDSQSSYSNETLCMYSEMLPPVTSLATMFEKASQQIYFIDFSWFSFQNFLFLTFTTRCPVIVVSAFFLNACLCLCSLDDKRKKFVYRSQLCSRTEWRPYHHKLVI
jgi:hypothetical protein